MDVWASDGVEVFRCTYIKKPIAACVMGCTDKFCYTDRDGDIVPIRDKIITYWMPYEKPPAPYSREEVPF